MIPARSVGAFALVLMLATSSLAQERAPILARGKRVAIVGDSITEQKQYSRFIELYLTACRPDLELEVIQLGWGGETAPGFAARMANDLLPWKPDVVTTCYGMNDAGYRKYEDAVGKRYRTAMADIVGRLKKAGALVVVGSPGVVDSTTFKNPNATPALYNENLGHLRDVARELAASEGQPFADVHALMLDIMEKAKAALGAGYEVAGRDGIHPGPNGHLVMAQAFLEALGVDGEIGTVTVDLQGTTSASEGHRVLSSDGGKVVIESSRWPFCFPEDKAPNAARTILPHTRFHERLNRFILVVKNLTTEKAQVMWGGATKTFSKADLEKGVNLAAEPIENPFAEAWKKLDALVAKKQAFETVMVKQTINSFPRLVDASGKDTELQGSLEALRKKLYEVQARLGANARAAVVPVKHDLVVTPR